MTLSKFTMAFGSIVVLVLVVVAGGSFVYFLCFLFFFCSALCRHFVRLAALVPHHTLSMSFFNLLLSPTCFAPLPPLSL